MDVVFGMLMHVSSSAASQSSTRPTSEHALPLTLDEAEVLLVPHVCLEGLEPRALDAPRMDVDAAIKHLLSEASSEDAAPNTPPDSDTGGHNVPPPRNGRAHGRGRLGGTHKRSAANAANAKAAAAAIDNDADAKAAAAAAAAAAATAAAADDDADDDAAPAAPAADVEAAADVNADADAAGRAAADANVDASAPPPPRLGHPQTSRRCRSPPRAAPGTPPKRDRHATRSHSQEPRRVGR
jgi:hypothetical protein